jgi:hypothetical protein
MKEGRVKTLLNDEFAPLTYQVGFLEATLENALEVFLKWQSEIGAEFDRQPRHERLAGSLRQALARLEPLTTPPTKVLLMETRSQWTAFFDNGLRVSDPESPVGHLCTILPSRGVVVHCAPDRSQTRDRNALRIYGIVSFRMFAAQKTSWSNQERAVVAMNDGGSWLFSADGIQQPFEEPESYKARRIADRLTGKMLERYCKALGIRVFDEAFYGTKAALINTIQKLPPGAPVMSLEEARSHIVAVS